MAVLEIQSNGESSYVSQEAINSAIQSLEDPLQRVSIDCQYLNYCIQRLATVQRASLLRSARLHLFDLKIQ